MLVSIPKQIYWAARAGLEAHHYKAFVISHKRYIARIIYMDVSGCPFTVDFFHVITWNKYGEISYSSCWLDDLSDYERSKLPAWYWETRDERRAEDAKGWRELAEEAERAEKKEEVA